jgi:hypothetical protein
VPIDTGREHGLQFKATHVTITQPTTPEGIEKYLGSGMIMQRATPCSRPPRPSAPLTALCKWRGCAIAPDFNPYSGQQHLLDRICEWAL